MCESKSKLEKVCFAQLSGSSLVRFEISVHNAIVVKVLQGKYGLCKIHPGHVDREGADVLQQVGTIST